ncbi:fibronectin type III domain-containing protein [Krasilnikovia sp. MM14-A1259]|uniref:fibronectin type III domain-containing protein n=1 Tax=Krasilnikovia sp. MM14-A1259 TaxID=3373539 RepID=UPI00399CDD87
MGSSEHQILPIGGLMRQRLGSRKPHRRLRRAAAVLACVTAFGLPAAPAAADVASVGAAQMWAGNRSARADGLAAPTNVRAETASQGIHVSWDPLVGASPSVHYAAYARPPGSTDPGFGCFQPTSEPGDRLGCTISRDLDPGAEYEVYAVAMNGVEQSAPAFAAGPVTAGGTPPAPDAPTITTVTAGRGTLTVSWDKVQFATSFTATAVATDGVSPGGTCHESAKSLSCTIKDLSAAVTYRVTVTATGLGGTSPSSAVATGVPTGVPTTPPQPPTNAPTLASDVARGETPAAGSHITVSGHGFKPGTTVEVALYSAPRVLARPVVAANGSFSATVTIPATYKGEHTFVATGTSPNGRVRYLALPVTIAAAGTGLPVTGSPVTALALFGLATVTAGGFAVFTTRRRKPRPTTA